MDKDLTACESLVMKAIWDAGGEISVPSLIETLKEKYGKDYARTTVVTFLSRLGDKDYVETCRRGKLSYVRALIREEDYKNELLQEVTDFWYEGSVSNLLSALYKPGKWKPEDVERMRKMLDELDN